MNMNAQMLAHLQKTVSPHTVSRSALLSELKAIHIATEKDDVLDKELEVILAHIISGNATEGFAILLSGKSGAGKSTILEKRLDDNPAFAPIKDEFGNELRLCLRLKTPASCSVKSLGKAILRATGYHLDRDRNEDYIWAKVTERLQKMQTRIIVLDEFQHVVNTPPSKGYLHLSDTIKNLMQVPGWPVWLILSGVPDIERFLDRDPNGQMDRRAPVIAIGNLEDDEFDRERVKQIIHVLAETCKCEIAFPIEAEFVRRLMHGGLFRLGTTIQLIKNALVCCMWDDEALKAETGEASSAGQALRWELAPRHFEEGYRRLSNCSEATNVFRASKWWEIVREVDEDGNLVAAAAPEKKMKASKK
ncbi:hypothetical protein ELG88_08385 [Rhizobium leguminosarum]|uniref:TniB family NTP-binding protein n=1 Tax=Rhizobium leguminosarum TaxID=384 RepID=UPI001031CE08|nr:TniB family NTP-binding protein [Rhizobium leguminosarum]TBF35231.1 hypothetical protein ELG88_08385 [Rhizobium leguminosarum]